MRLPLVRFFVVVYIILHVALCFVSPPDSTYYGVMLIPAAIFDYVLFVYAAYFLHRQSY